MVVSLVGLKWPSVLSEKSGKEELVTSHLFCSKIGCNPGIAFTNTLNTTKTTDTPSVL